MTLRRPILAVLLVLAMLIDSLAMIMKDLLLIYRLVTEVDLIAPRREIAAALRARDAARASALLREQFALTTQYVVDRAQLPDIASNAGA